MKSYYIISVLLLLSLMLYSCTGTGDGIYCTDVDRYNPKTGLSSSYTLTSEIADGKLIQLDFPNGGHLDVEEFGVVPISSNSASFTDGKGRQFKIRLLKKGGDCFDNVRRAIQCTGITKQGNRCKNMTDNESGRCHNHNE